MVEAQVEVDSRQAPSGLDLSVAGSFPTGVDLACRARSGCLHRPANAIGVGREVGDDHRAVPVRQQARPCRGGVIQLGDGRKQLSGSHVDARHVDAIHEPAPACSSTRGVDMPDTLLPGVQHQRRAELVRMLSPAPLPSARPGRPSRLRR